MPSAESGLPARANARNLAGVIAGIRIGGGQVLVLSARGGLG